MTRRLVAVTLVVLGLVSLAAPAPAAATDAVDVVYLKNGSRIRGTIVEQVPGRSLKIETADGSVFVYALDQVARITREAVAARVDPMPAVILLVNPLGFLQFGPIVDLELRTAPGLYLLAHLRLHGLGVLSHVMETTALSVPSLAGGSGLRYFFLSPGRSGAAYLGFLVELGHNWFVDGNETTYVSFVANGGYRWRFGGTMMNLGAFLGAAPTVANTYPNGPMPVTPVAMLELSFAWGL